MLAVLRYKRLPYRYWVGEPPQSDLPRPKVELLPTLYLPGADGSLEAVVDSTPLIRRLDPLVPERAVAPPDPALAFVDALIEDYGDEWLTKCMFHYRWAFPEDARKAAAILPLWRNITADPERMAAAATAFSERQIGRLHVVGSNAVTASVIEDSYGRFLQALDGALSRQPFLMGGRPGAADFAVFGQLTQLAHFDPTPARLTLERAPRVHAWVDLIEDLSGLEPSDADWIDVASLRAGLAPLFAEMGRTYAPVMLANAAALAAGDERVETEVEGRPWVQQPFPYQGRCVAQLRAIFAALAPDSQTTVREIVADPRCLALIGA
jgi:glutathione S-transferase